MKTALAAALLAMALSTPVAAAPQPTCGNTVTVRQADTISAIAGRCGISESMLMAANPSIESSGDLRVGEALKTQPANGKGVGTALSNLGTSAANVANGLADKVGSSVQELLDRNPDLKTRLQHLGNSVGLTNGQSEVSITISPTSGARGSTVTVAATGLPKDEPILIGAGPPGAAFEVIRSVHSSANGTLARDVTVPSLTETAGSVVFVLVGPDNTVQGRSARFSLTQ